MKAIPLLSLRSGAGGVALNLSSPLLKRLLASLLFIALLGARFALADGADDFAALQTRLNDSILDLYAGETIAPEKLPSATLPALAARLESPGARRLVAEFQQQTGRSPAQQIGAARGLLQHLAALEMIHRQQAGRVDDTRAWRSFIALPKYANAVDGALLLQQPDIKPRGHLEGAGARIPELAGDADAAAFRLPPGAARQ